MDPGSFEIFWTIQFLPASMHVFMNMGLQTKLLWYFSGGSCANGEADQAFLSLDPGALLTADSRYKWGWRPLEVHDFM